MIQGSLQCGVLGILDSTARVAVQEKPMLVLRCSSSDHTRSGSDGRVLAGKARS
jgi:hypothetical protein